MTDLIETLSVNRLCIGMPKNFGSTCTPSGIDKRLTSDSLHLLKFGFVGDGQGDLRHHGGLDKAVHHYSADHYEKWKDELPFAKACFDRDAPFGENVVGTGGNEASVCVGDVFSLGSALVQVSQARQPCWKLNERFGIKDMALRVQSSGRTGWYYRVLQTGVVSLDDHLKLVERPRPSWTLSRVLDLLYRDTLNLTELNQLNAVTELSESWRRLINRRLERAVVEDWSSRLELKS